MQDKVQANNMGNAVISVIVPVYKAERFLHKCVQSILDQTYPHLEVILVNDGSPDSCAAICDAFALQDARVQVIHQQNAGLSAARNTGLKHATGMYIGFVDSDDYIDPKMYERLLFALVDARADSAVCNYRLVDENGFFIEDVEGHIEAGVLNGQEEILHPLGQDYNWRWVVACTKLYKRSLFDDVRFPVGKLHEDEFVVHRILLKCKRVVCIADKLYYYVQHDSGITRSGFSVRRLDCAEALFERAALFLQHGVAPLAAYYACASGLRVMANGYRHLNLQDADYRKRYKELTRQYREAARPLLKKKLPPLLKARLSMNMLSPYYTWKLLERRMRTSADVHEQASPATADKEQP